MSTTRFLAGLVAVGWLVWGAATASAQVTHDHGMAVNGVPGGLPYFCANPTVTSVADGAWSNPATWSTKTVPAANDKVLVAAGHTVTYDAVSDAAIQCIDLRGRLGFKTDASTRLRVVDLTVMEGGVLEVGTPAAPVRPSVTAEIVIADRATDRVLDPAQVGTGIEALGTVTMSGAPKSPTFARLAKEPLAGQRTLTFEQSVAAWKPGDRLVLPDTRQLRASERNSYYKSQDEKVEIASVAGATVTLTSALAYDHRGAHDADGALVFLPHAGNLSRNVVVRSENPRGTRGHMLFMARANVDLRFVEVREMGRTRMGVLDSTEFDAQGKATHLGENQIGRYAIHFHHDFGPTTPPKNGYQFTLVGTSVDGAPKWGVTVHNSHYGLIQDNVVYNTRGAGIVTEDGTESFNLFDHNFALRSEGSGEFAPVSGYSGVGNDPGGEGAGFWFRGPNNYIRNNVAANGDVFGFGLAAGALGTIRIPKAKGADMNNPAQTTPIDTTDAKVLEFANNEAYGAIQTGVAWGWNGVLARFRVWNSWRNGVTGTPTDSLEIDAVVVRGDKAVLADEGESPAGIWFGNYMSKNILIRDADVQGMRVGVASPFFRADQSPEPGRGGGAAVIENSRFRDYVGIVVATSYVKNAKGDAPLKSAVVRNSVFEPLDVPVSSMTPPAAISMNYRMARSDADPREPISVFDFNKKPGDSFQVYYSLDAPPTVAPCHDTRTGIGGWVCK